MGMTTFSNSLAHFFGDEEFKPAQMGGHYTGENTRQHPSSGREVKYSEPDKRTKYKITVGDVLTWTSRRNGHETLTLLDCKEIHDMYKEKWNSDDRNKPKPKLGAFVGDLERSDQMKWIRSLIWVIGTDGTAYSNIPKLGRFQHSTFTAGENVMAAGMWLVSKGRLVEIAPLSGHYLPNMRQFMTGVVALKSAVKASRTSLFLYSLWDNAYKSVEYGEWSKMSFEDLNNRYSPHHTVRPMQAKKKKRRKIISVGYVFPDLPIK